nr:ribonuclease H-like domain-containing protein [Tanacetum cinerariifolium]
RKNRNLIEAARIMLAYSLLPIPFWSKAVNTACYVQNRVLVTKPHNKTPYELLLGRSPSIGFMRPFGCPVTILNALNLLGKFDGKADEGFLVGYSNNSKAFRVFNSRTRIVQETLHINFLENQPNVVRSGPKWQFDIDTLTQSINYQPVVAGNQPNHSVGIKENLDADKVRKKTKSAQQYVLLPLWSTGLQDPQNIDDVDDAAFDVKDNESEVHVSPRVKNLRYEFEECFVNSTNRVNAASAPVTAVRPNPTNITNSVNAASPSDNTVSSTFVIGGKSSFMDPSQYPDDLDMPTLEDIVYSDDEEDVGAEADFSNLETSIAGHTQEEGIDYEEDFTPVARIEAIRLFLAYASFMGFMVYQMDVKSAFLYETIKEEVYVCQPLGFEDPDYPDKIYKVVKALYGLHQAPRAWRTYFLFGIKVKKKVDMIFINQDKYVAKILRKFGLTDSKSASTPIDTEKPLLKDPDGKDVDVYIQTVVATSSTEAEYVVAASCCAQVPCIQNQLLDYGLTMQVKKPSMKLLE